MLVYINLKPISYFMSKETHETKKTKLYYI